MLRALPFSAALAYFVFMAHTGLTMSFSADDMMNIHKYWTAGAGRLVKALVLIDPSFYRPLGSLFYLPLYQVFGLSPGPYRVTIFVILCLNTYLLYRLATRLSGSRWAGALGAMVGSFHASANGAYLSTAVVYDVLCLFFLLSATLFYVRVRQRGRGRLLGWRASAVVMLLFVAALDAKEMAVALPVVLVAYELIHGGWRPNWMRVAAPLGGLAVIAAIYTAGKLFGAESLIGLDAYKPEWTPARYLITARYYAGMMFFEGDAVGPIEVAGLWIGLFGVAALLRRKDMLFGAAFALIAFLPVNFMLPREGYPIYIPMAGLGIWAGGFLWTLIETATSWTAVGVRDGAAAAVLVIAVAALMAIHYPREREQERFVRHAQGPTRQVLEEFRKMPVPARGGSLLVRGGPFGEYWDMLFIAKLFYRDPALRVAITTPEHPEPRGDVHENFDQVFEWKGERLVVESR